MKKFPKDRKRYIAGAIAIVLAALMIFGSIAPFIMGSENPVEVSVEVGYSGFHKVGYPTPIKATITNNAAAFDGEVRFNINKGDSINPQYAIHSYPAVLPENSTRIFTLDIVIDSLSEGSTLQLVDNKGHVVYQMNITLRPIDPSKVVAAALTDDADSLSYLKAMAFGYDNLLENRLIFMDAETFPENSDQLGMFDILFISNYDTGRLSSRQADTIESWVLDGGALVLGTGVNHSKVMNSLGNLVALEDVRQERVSGADVDLSVIGEVYGYAAEGEDSSQDRSWQQMQDFDISHFDCGDANKRYPIGTEDTIFMTSVISGNGKILISGLDLCTYPLNTVQEARDYLASILLLEFTEISRTNVEDHYNYYSRYKYSNIPSMGSNMISLIFLVIAVYIVVIGPVLYLILKRKDKREYGFVLIPASAVVFTLIIYGMSYNTIYKRPIINNFNYVNLYNGDSRVNYTSKAGALIAQKGNVSIDLKNPMSSVRVLNNSYNYYYGSYYNNSRSTGDLYKITYWEDQNRITYFDCSSWDTNMFSYGGSDELDGSIDMEVGIVDGVITGTVYNGTGLDLEDVLIGIQYNFENYGDLKAGDTLEFTMDQGILSNNHYLDSYALLPVNYYNRDEQYRRMELKRSLLDEKYESDYYYGADYSEIILYAFSSAQVGSTEIEINRKTPIEFNNTIYYMAIPFSMINEDPFSLGFGIIGVGSIESKDYYYFYGDGLEIYDAGEFVLGYDIPVSELERVQLFEFKEPEVSYGAIEALEIYNISLEEWEELLFEPYDANVFDYITRSGSIAIRLTVAEEIYMTVPEFRIEGSGLVG